MATIRLINHKSFEAATGTVLLDAALAAGVVLEHSCRTGRCGTCRAKVLSGTAEPRGDQSGLSEQERLDGWILTCGSTAATDLSLDTEDVSELADYPAKTLPCRIDSIEKLAPDVVKLTLRYPPNTELRHLAGQYVDVIGKNGLRRSYSIANHGQPLARTELHVRQVEGGAMSQYWFVEAKPNDLLRVEGPKGTFFLRSLAGLDLIFLATGTGIAPVKAMLAALGERDPADLPSSISLYWGGRKETDLYWQPAAEAAGLAVRYVPVLSRAGGEWAGARGHVQDVLLQQAPDLSRSVVYACGSAAMIDSAKAQLSAAGLPPRRFFSDAFVSSST